MAVADNGIRGRGGLKPFEPKSTMGTRGTGGLGGILGGLVPGGTATGGTATGGVAPTGTGVLPPGITPPTKGQPPPMGGNAGVTGAGTVTANPYLDKMYNEWQNQLKQLQAQYAEQSKKEMDPTAAREAARDSTAYAMKEAQAGMGRRGFGGSSGLLNSQRMNIASQGARDENKAVIDFKNEGLRRQDALLNNLGGLTASFLGGQSGVASNEASNELGRLAALNAANQTNLEAWKAVNQLPLEWARVQNQTAGTQLSALAQLMSML